MKIERIELPEKLTEKTACEFVGRIAAVCSGKYPKSDEVAERIGRINLTEDFNNQPTVAWEFLPVFGEADHSNFRGNIKQDKKYFTLEEMCRLYNIQDWLTEDFHIFKLTVPKMVRDHMVKHRTLSIMSSSKRLGGDGEVLYEFPEIELGQNMSSAPLTYNDGHYCYNKFTGKEFTELLEWNYYRKEITKRSLSDFEVVEIMCAGWEDAWNNFINVRTITCDNSGVCPNPKCEKPCIQKETRYIAEQIKEAIK